MTKSGKWLAFLLVLAILAGFCIPAAADAAGPASSSGLSIGDTVVFGRYEQDGKPGNGPEDIEWIALEVHRDKVLLLSRCGLDAVPYNTEKINKFNNINSSYIWLYVV